MSLSHDEDLFGLLEEMGEDYTKLLPKPTRHPSSSTSSSSSFTTTTNASISSLWNPTVVFNPQTQSQSQSQSQSQFFNKPSHPFSETLRHRAYESLKTSFREIATNSTTKKFGKSSFESWWFLRKLIEDQNIDRNKLDPVLPSPISPSNNKLNENDDLLAMEVLGKSSKKFVKAISEAIRTHHASFEASRSSSKQAMPKKPPKISHSKDGDVTTVKYMGKEMKLNRAYYEKLLALFERRNGNKDNFSNSLYSLLLRYDTLEGAGYQAAITPMVYDVLLSEFGAKMEMFASPLNCRYGVFCSAFEDTDGVFGSRGSVWDFDPSVEGGSFEANPPFVDGVITKMAERFEMLLEKAERRGVGLSFCIIVPKWEGREGWKKLRGGRYLRGEVEVKQKDHYYCEGSRYRRGGEFRIASFDTSVFFWQNEGGEGNEKWALTKEKEKRLRRAFGARGEEEKEEKEEEKEKKSQGKKRRRKEASS